jgi:glycosyltransferase involved in cell wall biosynthesis
VIPNGIHLPDFDSLPPSSLFRDAFPETRDKRIALFMARLHVKKGLEHLLRAWARLHRGLPEWQLVVAGPDCGFGHQAKEIVETLSLSRSVTFTGNLRGEMRLAALAAAQAFLHPSFSEGFSMAVLEALACRLPVLITPGCNFREAAVAGAAIEVSPDTESTAEGLNQLLAADAEQLRAMGQLGRALIERKYTWDRVAEQTLELYHWLAHSSPAPQFVCPD